tara:strand:- start:646 stop:828 length:183 start_codon:yes stop_codon:yes gene_type:complete
MPIQKKKKGKTTYNKKLPENEEMSKNYVSIRPPKKSDNKIKDKDIFEGCGCKNKSKKKKY